MLFFKDKKLVNIEKTLNNERANMDDKLNALSEYLPYLAEIKDQKKENEVFMEIIKALKDKNNAKTYIGKELLWFDDRRNKRMMLNVKFMKVISSFSFTQTMVFASTLENIEPYLDIFIAEKGEKLRIDFKNIVPMKSIDIELFRKRSNMEANNQIVKFLSSKNIFLLNGVQVEGCEPLNPKFFYDMMPYMGEKTYPICYNSELDNVISYLSPREIERYIQDNASYMPFGQYLDNCNSLKIKLMNQTIELPMNLLKRNSNFYIIEN